MEKAQIQFEKLSSLDHLEETFLMKMQLFDILNKQDEQKTAAEQYANIKSQKQKNRLELCNIQVTQKWIKQQLTEIIPQSNKRRKLT